MKTLNLKTMVMQELNKPKVNDKVDSLHAFIQLHPGDFVAISSRPSNGRTNILLDLLLQQNVNTQDNALLLSAHESTITTLLKKLAQAPYRYEGIITPVKQFTSIDQLKALITTTLSKRLVQTIYLDDIERYTYSQNEIKLLITFLDELVIHKNIAVVMTCQTNPKMEERGGILSPRMGDISNTAVEKVCNKVYGLYRPAYYGFTTDENNISILNAVEINTLRDKDNKKLKDFRHVASII